MATYLHRGVAFSGIAACVPENAVLNIDNPIFETKEDAEKFITLTGVEKLHHATADICTSDLTYAAATELLSKLNWTAAEVGILICITQTPDFHGPMNSSILQNKLGLTKESIAFDIPVGCSGYVYGTSVITSMMKAIGIQKGLLLVGDTLSKQASPKDKSTQPLFGDAGTATAFTLTNDDADTICFDLGGDGAGYPSLFLKEGGYRFPFNEHTLEYVKAEDGIERNGCHTIMDGMEVFSFGISTAPKTFRNVLEFAGVTMEEIDAAVFHQANKFMNENIRKKLKLTKEQVPYSINKFGNTSSATIPLTIVSELKDKMESGEAKLVMCGFGIGLSWGTMYAKTNKLVVPGVLKL